MSDETSREFIEYLGKSFQGEVVGEATFKALADAAPNEDARYKWRVCEAIERETKELLGRCLAERGHPTSESEERRKEGETLGRLLAKAPYDLFMKRFREELVRFVSEFAGAEKSAPADARDVARHLVVHEEALLAFVDLELAGKTSDSAAPVRALLAHPPARPH